MLRASDLFTFQTLGLLVAGYCVYGLSLVVYRFYLSPLSKFPGPKLAAATFWYEFYYDAVLGGQYTFHIAQLHKKYGPVIRINPHEIHVLTPEFYDVLYTGPGRRRHKWHWAMRGFGSDKATFATVLHEVHRMRKTALNSFFSMGQVRRLEPVIQDIIDAFMLRVEGFQEEGQVLRIDTACSALTADIIMEYAIGKPSRIINVPDFDLAFHDALLDGGRQLFMTRQFPIVMEIVRRLPRSVMLRLNPSLTSFWNLQMSIGRQVAQVLKELPGGQTETHGPKHIFRAILDSKLPPEEKTFSRLAQEGGVLIGAGTLTTAWSLTVAIFYLLREPRCLARLKQELQRSMPEKSSEKSLLPALESLPYFNAIMQETLRLSYGVATRLARIAPDEDLVVPAPSGGGKQQQWRIPRNTIVSMTQLHMFQNEDLFPSPRQFRPGRWIEEPELMRFMVAFGKGSRQCLGKNLALAEIYLTLATLFSKYGSKEVKFEGDVGYLELYETDESDVECTVDGFLPLPKNESKGVRIKVIKW
ncbi:Cytochrome P450 [Rhypophila decipiens]